MEWTLSRAANAATEIARATDPAIRHFKIPHTWSGQRQWQLEGGSWIASSPETAGDFSAVAHLFAREIRDRRRADRTGSTARGAAAGSKPGWMRKRSVSTRRRSRATRSACVRAAAQSGMRSRLAHWGPMPADDAGWQAEHLDERDWLPISVPMLWEQVGGPVSTAWRGIARASS